MGQDACLPCGTQSWAELRGATIGCSHRAGDSPGVTVLFHRLDGHPPPFEPGWLPPEQPQSRFRGRVAFCPSGPGEQEVTHLLKNISDADFGNYFCYAARNTGPQMLCMVELQPSGAEVPKAVGQNTLLVICVLTATIITMVTIGHGAQPRSPEPWQEAWKERWPRMAKGGLKSLSP